MKSRSVSNAARPGKKEDFRTRAALERGWAEKRSVQSKPERHVVTPALVGSGQTGLDQE